eukprot:1267241-Pleurochrysis_carterae.AAC.1
MHAARGRERREVEKVAAHHLDDAARAKRRDCRRARAVEGECGQGLRGESACAARALRCARACERMRGACARACVRVRIWTRTVRVRACVHCACAR